MDRLLRRRFQGTAVVTRACEDKELKKDKELTCPLCDSTSFRPESQTLNLTEVLDRWQNEAGIAFRRSTKQAYTAGSTTTLYRCGACNLQIFLPAISGTPDFYADITAGEYYIAEKWEFYQAIKDIKRFKRTKVLDIGCGNGHFLKLMATGTKGVQLTGYEFNSSMADAARAKGFNVYTGHFPDTLLDAYGEGHFDAICLFQIIEHVPDPVGFIRDVSRLLAPGGLFIVGAPDSEGPLRYFSHALTDIPPHHVSRWSRKTFEAGMGKFGLRLIRSAYEPLPGYLWQGYLPPIIEHLPFIGGRRAAVGIAHVLISILSRLRVKWLHGVRGHTVYVVLEKDKS